MKKYLPHILIISVVFIAIPITSATGGSITLRSHHKSLSASQVQSMPNVSIRKKQYWDFMVTVQLTMIITQSHKR